MRFFRSLAGAALFVASAFSTPAQHLGDVSLSSVQATLANNATCTGAAQNFTTGDVGLPLFNNIGQTSHLATATSAASSFTMEIDGIDNLGNVFRLSDSQVGIPSAGKGGLVVTAAGYMPRIRVSIVCTAAATFSVSYSGSFSPQPPSIAAALLVSIDKIPFQNAPANANASATFQSPTGSSQGTVIFQYAAAGPSGSTITVQCLSNAGTNLSLFTFALGTQNTAQLFTVPPTTCPFVTLSYISGGASATTFALEYTFTTSGNNSAASDPCLSASVVKQSQPFNITTGTTTQVIPLTAGQTIYPCSLVLDISTNSSAVFSVQFEYGTGAACATGTTALTGTMVAGASTGTGPVFLGLSGPTIWQIPVGNALCILTTLTGAPTAPQGVQGSIGFAKQ